MTVGEMRARVIARDGGCVARRLDPDAGECYDAWGGPAGPHDLEADYVRRGARGSRHVRADDHVALCPRHHRGTGATGGYVWATAHRAELRDYLEGKR